MNCKNWPEGTRGCVKCKLVKPFEFFDLHARCYKGYNSVCKECRKPLSTASWARTTPEYRMWHRAKFRAREKDLPFNLEIADLVTPELCPVLGVPFIEGDSDYTTSLDKLDPKKGYVKGNVQVITNKANRLKNNGTLDELKKVVAYLEKHCEL